MARLQHTVRRYIESTSVAVQTRAISRKGTLQAMVKLDIQDCRRTAVTAAREAGNSKEVGLSQYQSFLADSID